VYLTDDIGSGNEGGRELTLGRTSESGQRLCSQHRFGYVVTAMFLARLAMESGIDEIPA
jgi:hypothetical protein